MNVPRLVVGGLLLLIGLSIATKSLLALFSLALYLAVQIIVGAALIVAGAYLLKPMLVGRS